MDDKKITYILVISTLVLFLVAWTSASVKVEVFTGSSL